jgi:cytochrome bd-type quinol oxidase subunit 2
MSNIDDPSGPFADFASPPEEGQGAAQAYLNRIQAERRRRRWHWAIRGISFLVVVVIGTIVAGVSARADLAGYGFILLATTMRAAVGGLCGAGLALLLLMLSAVNYRRMRSAHFQTVGVWILMFPFVLTILLIVGIVCGTFLSIEKQ